RRRVQAALVERALERSSTLVGGDEERRRLAAPAHGEVRPERDAVLGQRRFQVSDLRVLGEQAVVLEYLTKDEAEEFAVDGRVRAAELLVRLPLRDRLA